MGDDYVKVRVQLEQMRSFGEDAEKEEEEEEESADAEEQQLPGSSPPHAPVSPDPSSVTIAGSDTSSTSITCKQRGKSRSRPGRDDKNSCGKHLQDLSLHGSAHAGGKNLNRLGHERTLHIRGTGKILQGKSETNGNYVSIHPSKNIPEVKLANKRRPVTVDTAKAKTSLEALKISIKQLKWKEVSNMRASFFLFLCLSWRKTAQSLANRLLVHSYINRQQFSWLIDQFESFFQPLFSFLIVTVFWFFHSSATVN